MKELTRLSLILAFGYFVVINNSSCQLSIYELHVIIFYHLTYLSL